MSTCQGHVPCLAFIPPIIRVLLLGVPHRPAGLTTHGSVGGGGGLVVGGAHIPHERRQFAMAWSACSNSLKKCICKCSTTRNTKKEISNIKTKEKIY